MRSSKETENLKIIRWKQRFENFEKSYSLLEGNFKKENLSELERAGLIQFFEMTIHTYDDEIAERMQKNIQKKYFYILQNLYLKLSKEI